MSDTLNSFSKLFVRIAIVGVAFYLVLCYAFALFVGVDIWDEIYKLPLELALCLCITAQGKYHCKYIRWTAYGVFISDTIVVIDNIFDIFPVGFMVLVPCSLMILGLFTTLALAARHYFKVRKLKKSWQNQHS